ncbi:MAG: cell envelope integrity EipB family protein [Alphaproteobacteria bacterium]|nr:cell envelope integrity EipB family protein [Alphaproteobacteria bacterium]
MKLQTVSVSLALFAFLGAANAAPAADLLPHRAYYDIRLKDSRWGSGISSLSGKLVVEFNNTCDGYTLNQRFVTQMGDSEGNLTVSDLWLTSWESADGKAFRFNLKNEVNGTVVESFQGRARGGLVSYEGNDTKDVTLPRDAIFPTEHAVDLIEAALAGDTFVQRTIFDGSGEGEIYTSFATIGREQPQDKRASSLEGVEGAEGIDARHVWPVTISYYPVTSEETLPEYEVSFLMYENGVSSHMVLDYGEFSVTGALTKIEPLPKPNC